MKKVLVFGVFDGVHEGHRALFREAKSHGDHLIVAVAQDEIVEELKGRRPKNDIAARIEDLRREEMIDEVVPGDKILGTYEVIRTHNPAVIAIGYDQIPLKKDIEESFGSEGIEIVVMQPFEPERYHSSLLDPKIK